MKRNHFLAALVLVAIALPHPILASQTMKSTPMTLKMVKYRDAVSFPLPVSWVVEDEPGVQGIFYENAPSTGTLRVSVLQWKRETEEQRDDVVKSILGSGNVETLKQGVYLKKEVAPGSEDGEALLLHRWLVVLALPANTCRLISFTHTITASQNKDAHIVAELKAVDFAVRSAVFSFEPNIPLVDTP